MSNPTLDELLKAGVHFGHKASRWNPKMAPFIFTVRNKFHIIDLEKTHKKIEEAQKFISNTVKVGGTILFVGTKRQTKSIVKEAATSCGMPYVTARWLGGTLTNFKTIQRSIKKMGRLEELLAGTEIKNYTKKERLMLQREFNKSTILFEGLRNMKKMPDAILVADTINDIIAVKEARVMKIKIIAITDTNSDPSIIDYPIPANDDAIKSVDLIVKSLAEAAKRENLAESAKVS